MVSGIMNVKHHPLPPVHKNVNANVASLLRTSEELNSEARS